MRTTPADVLRSLAFYVVFYLGSVFFVATAILSTPLGEGALRRIARGWSKYHRLCARVLLGIKVVVEGELPRSGVIVAVKHESFFEAIDLPALLEWPAPFPKSELAEIPGWGRAAKCYGIVIVEREAGAKALRNMVANAREFVAKGRELAIFPEGTRVPSGQRLPLQSGFAGVYKLLKLPVIPVAVNSGRLYHRRWKKPGTITFRVGERIEAGLSRDALEARVQDAINALNDKAPDGQAAQS